MTSSPSAFLETLAERQRSLYRELAQSQLGLATMYLGSVQVLQQVDNPDRLALAAHGLRELMEKLPEDPKFDDLPVPKRPINLGDKVNQLKRPWRGVIKQYSNHESGPVWDGPIDNALRRFLETIGEFFTWLDDHRPTRRKRIAVVLRKLDPPPVPLPEPIEDLRIQYWERCYEFFEKVAHHRAQPDDHEFLRWLGAKERFLLDYFRPRTSEDHSKLDQIIAKGEGHAQP